MIADVCNSSTPFRFRYNNAGFEICQLIAGNPNTYEFIPVCGDSSFYSCANCNLTCQNGGTCVTESSFSMCLCLQNWGGTTCETRVNDCVLNTACLTDNIPFTQCIRSMPYEEPYFQDICQLSRLNCHPSSCSLTCQNNGTCITETIRGNTTEFCFCANGYTGTLCNLTRTPFNESTLCSASSNVPTVSSADYTVPTICSAASNDSTLCSAGSNDSTLCSAGYNISALWTLIVLVVFALYIVSVI